MHVLYVHQNFPAQFGHVAERLIEQHGFRCTFLTENLGAPPGRIEPIQYQCRGEATRATHPMSRTFEGFTWRSQAAFEALRNRPDVRPDLIVGHSGFGSTLFMRDFYDCPIVNYCEWFYHRIGSHEEFLSFGRERNCPAPGADRSRDASLLADLDACTLAYSPTHWQRSRIPHEYQYKLETIFDGIDTSFWRPMKTRELGIRRRVAGRGLPRRKKVVTYVSRGFESMRGFDIFMQVAQRICERRSDVVFLCIGSDRVCYGPDMANIKERSFREHVLKSGRFDLDRFIFTGHLPREELRRALAYSDLHIYLTAPFVLSWSLMNALACGCTVLVSDTQPLREVVEHGQNGLMAPYYDIDHFVELALAVLDDPLAYRRALGAAGLEMIQKHYDLDVVLPRMINLYERAIRREVGRPSSADRNVGDAAHREPISINGNTIGLPDQPRTAERGRESFSAAGNGHPQASGCQPPRKKNPDPLASNDGWLSASEAKTARGLFHRDAKLILEIGAWRGQTTRFFAQHCPLATILAVDTWHGAQYRQPEHPEWKAMLPDVWDSFVRQVREFGERVISVRQRHDEAVREIAARGLVPDVIYYDPDYNRRSVRQTLLALTQAFPRTLLVGHDWSWHGVRAEVSRAATGTGRRLSAGGNLWWLAPAPHPAASLPVPSSNGNEQRRNALFRTGQPRTADLHSAKRNGQPRTADLRPRKESHAPLRVLVTIPHFFRPDSSRLYGSGTAGREERSAAVQACVDALFGTFVAESYTTNLARPENLNANAGTQVRLHIVMRVCGDDNLLGEIDIPAESVEVRRVSGDPLFLGYACQEVLRDRLGDYDFYTYMEDDLVLTDPWHFAKLRWFCEMVGNECLLQPNRFELARGRESFFAADDGERARSAPVAAKKDSRPLKAYIDGDLPPEKTARYQDISEQPVLAGRFLGAPVTFRRTLNPHAGCFFLNTEQMRAWSEKPYFLDRDATFYSPLEGAASVGVMRTFRVYKPARENANFLEIRHVGDGYLRKLTLCDQQACSQVVAPDKRPSRHRSVGGRA